MPCRSLRVGKVGNVLEAAAGSYVRRWLILQEASPLRSSDSYKVRVQSTRIKFRPWLCPHSPASAAQDVGSAQHILPADPQSACFLPSRTWHQHAESKVSVLTSSTSMYIQMQYPL